MRYILIGRGKMGTLIRETAAAAGDEIEAVFGHDDLDRLGQLGKVADVVIDFSRPEALPEIASYVRRTGTALLSGTTGYTEAEKEALFALGTARAGAVERQLLPGSGGALPGAAGDRPRCWGRTSTSRSPRPTTTRRRMPPAAPRSCCWRPWIRRHYLRPVYGREGSCGRREKDEIGIHALRGGTVAGTHTVHFFGPDEELELTHRAASRRIFVSGALKMARLLPEKPNGVYDLQNILFGE